MNFLDRGLIGLLLQPIKQDLHLSDTQLGFLTGIAFGLFYSVLGVPMARWADRGDRVTLTSIAIALWGLTVMTCLFVTNFYQLILARVAASIGEAGCLPPTYSLLGDYFKGSAERVRAMSVYWLAGPLSALLSFTLGGWLNQHLGWRLTFFVMGIPALLIAAVVKRTVVEPRVLQRPKGSGASLQPPLSKVLADLWSCRSSRHLMAAIILLFVMGLGLAPWYGAFLIRSHGMTIGELGVWLGLIFGLGGAAGTFLGGYLASRWFATNERGQMRFSAIAVGSQLPFFILFLFLTEKVHALIAFVPLVVTFNLFVGPSFALLQRLVAPQIRATTLAIVMLLGNLIGMGLGPQAVGLLSDWLQPALGTDSLRYAMLGVAFVTVWAAWHFWQAGRAMQGDLLYAT
jgi:MFS family permease